MKISKMYSGICPFGWYQPATCLIDLSDGASKATERGIRVFIEAVKARKDDVYISPVIDYLQTKDIL